MNRREAILGIGACTALACLAVGPASADGKRVALVIGNSTYKNVPALPNPANDAGDIAAALKRLGFAVTLITDASFDEMRRSLIALGRDAAGADMAVVFYAGHGMEINGENWLIPVDAELLKDTDAANEAVNLGSVMMQVSNTKSLGLIILDACRNNPFAAKMRRSLALRVVDRSGLCRPRRDHGARRRRAKQSVHHRAPAQHRGPGHRSHLHVPQRSRRRHPGNRK
jgi:hypothetical protein